MTDQAMRLPCGCVIDTVGDAFVIQPCSLRCQYFRYAMAEAKRQGKPVGTITDPTDLVRQDREAWPHGHPCRDCGQLAADHPTRQCDGWR